MELIKIIGIIAIIVFLVAYIGNRAISWFVVPGTTLEKVEDILSFVATGGLAIAASCGIIHLFA